MAVDIGTGSGLDNDGIFNSLAYGNQYGEGYDIILLMGQSNMQGKYGPVDPFYDRHDPRIFEYGSSRLTVGTAKDPLRHPTQDDDTVGPGLSLAKAYANQYLQKGRKVLLVPRAYSGSGFSAGYWTPTGSGYTTSVSMAQEALAIGSGTNRIVAAFWQQGEADMSVSESDYVGYIDTLISDLRSDLSLPNLPFIIGEIHPDSTQYGSGVMAALMDTPFRNDNVSMVKTSDLTLGADSLHFEAESARVLGDRYSIAYRAIQNGSFKIASDFDSQSVGDAPDVITDVNSADVGYSTEIVDSGSSILTGNYMAITGSITGSINTLVSTLDTVDDCTNHRVQWQLDAGSGKLGFLLRTTNKRQASGSYTELRDGYYFQVDGTSATGTLKLFRFSSLSFSLLGTSATGIDLDANTYFRATVYDSTLTFEYSADGETWTETHSVTDTNFDDVGAVEMVAGFGSDMSSTFLKSVEYVQYVGE